MNEPGAGVSPASPFPLPKTQADEAVHSIKTLPVNDYPLLLWFAVLLIAAAMMVYAITVSFVWDEGFHLLAAQLISKGHIPYIDFCFPQTPLNAYWNAALIKWAAWKWPGPERAGMSWRITHIVATLGCISSMVLVTDFLFRRQPGVWRFPLAMIIAFATGLNQTFWKFGTCAQAYGSGTFLAVCAYRLLLRSPLAERSFFAMAAGFAAGAAAASTLLTAPVLPVMLIWLSVYNFAGSRWRKAIAFCAGAAIPFLPVFWLFLKAPRQTLFNVVQYQAIFRRVNWPGATGHDFDVLTAWLSDSAIFVIGLLAIAGVYAARSWSGTSITRRAEIYLSAALCTSLTLYIATAHPTFQRYFVFAIPFAAIPAAIGFRWFAAKCGFAERPFWPACAMCGLLLLSLVREIYDDRDAITWNNYVQITNKVRSVTPAGALMLADEQVYFLMDLVPPSGMEFSYSHKLDLSDAEEARYHIVSEKKLGQQVATGRFATVETCKDDRIEDMHLNDLFPQQQDIGDCTIFWGPVKPLKPETKKEPKTAG